MTTTSDALPPVPSPGHLLSMDRAGATLSVGAEIKRGGEGIIYEARLRDHPFAVKWRWPFNGIEMVQEHIDSLIGLGSPHLDFVWPLDLVSSDDLPGFGYVMPLVDRSRFISVSQMILQSTETSDAVPYLRSLVTIGRKIVEAFEALHGKGLCYRDISLSNIMVDPERAEIAIVDNDNVGKSDEPTFIQGTRKFMAPEIVRGGDEVHPSTATDLFSLATLLFRLFMKSDPLSGIRSEAAVSWNTVNRVSDTTAHLQTYGLDPLFVFDPFDASNRPPPGDPSFVLWPFYPDYLRRLFTQAFTEGLAPSLTGRVMEGRWRRAMLRLADSISSCQCRAALIYDPDNPAKPCWQCGEVPNPPVKLEMAGGTVVLCEGATISAFHLDKKGSHEEIVGRVEIPRNTSVHTMTIRNLSSKTWTVVPEGEDSKSVEPEQRLGVRPMTLNFGAGAGRIHRAESSDTS
jgi:DNA-binding helix-hairpin-helix protein with protein kinase domain